jgi:hypothetical protein
MRQRICFFALFRWTGVTAASCALLKKPATKRSDLVHHKPQTTFFTLPPDIALPEPRPVATSLPVGCRLLVERADGARLALTLPSLDLASITKLCADFLRD